MASVPPGDITTLPAVKVIFNAPFDDKHTYYMKIINSGGHRIGFAFKTTNPRRLNMDPPNGVLDPKEAINIAISCDAFDPAAEATNNDRVTVEWTNTRKEQPSNSAASGSRVTVWFAARTFQSSTTCKRLMEDDDVEM
uniref:Major sperm protein n=1 Tax=Meloidogyne enterolobii TaxID=390850 RepID=A0A6V7UXW2_MELEN|nr:unnamed protein product [Meloidogyne enterolobii]